MPYPYRFPRCSSRRQVNRAHGGLPATAKSGSRRTWKHSFVCLAKVMQDMVPDSAERVQLLQAGLGERQLCLDIHCPAADLHKELLSHYPRLKDGGGYQFLRIDEKNRKYLACIPPPPGGYSVEYLKSAVHQAKLYIRPVQQDLDVTPTPEDVCNLSAPEEKCMGCGVSVPLHRIADHLNVCTQNTMKSDSSDDISVSPLDNDSQNEADEIEEQVLQEALSASRREHEQMQVQTGERVTELKDILSGIACSVTGEQYVLAVRRDFVYQDAIRGAKRRSFSPTKTLVVDFLGECAEDLGGPRREFFSILQGEIETHALEGHPQYRVFRHDTLALHARTLFSLGQLVATSIAQGGAGLPCLSPGTYSYLCGCDMAEVKPTSAEVPDSEIKVLIDQLESCVDNSSLKAVVARNCCPLVEVGFVKAAHTVTLDDKPTMIRSLTTHHILRCKAELDQFREGLQALNVAEYMTNNIEMMRPLFTASQQESVTADAIIQFLKDVSYSHNGTPERRNEEQAFMYFLDYLEDCSDGLCEANLGDVLMFFSGARVFPPCGFGENGELNFNPVNPYPTASTCSFILTLPTKYEHFDEFKRALDLGFTCHGGFGLL